MLGLCWLHDEQVFDSDPELPILVVSGLVAANHAFLQWRLVGKSGRNALWAFVHVQSCSDPMASSMQVVQPPLPQRSSRIRIKNVARRVLWPNALVYGDVPFQDAGVHLLLEGCRLGCVTSKVIYPRAIGCSALILPTAINKKHTSRLDSPRSVFSSSIMDYSTVRALPYNGGETRFEKARLLRPEISKLSTGDIFADRLSLLR
mmetsp:Transcript_20457/g.32991  ORF Transcript_20457/g.32991 Transcript_20457/m.32991 type:complete len:204 (+) Transcript_20457:542-1153(+)